MLIRGTTSAFLRLGACLPSILPAQAVAHEAYAELPGARIFYIDTGGSGVPVVFLHAATGSSRVWEYQIPAFTAAGYRLIAFDRRGWGRTIVDPAGPQSATAADDLRGLLDHLGITRVHLVGTAAGAFAALTSRSRFRSECAASSSPTRSPACRTRMSWNWAQASASAIRRASPGVQGTRSCVPGGECGGYKAMDGSGENQPARGTAGPRSRRGIV